MRTIIAVTLGIVASNFIYQAATTQQWAVAVERSWFQVTAILILCFALWRNYRATKVTP